MTETAASPDGTLERTPDGGVIRFERHLPYPVEAVWDAITNPARLADWWLPFDADITIDLREGGEMVFTATSGEPPPHDLHRPARRAAGAVRAHPLRRRRHPALGARGGARGDRAPTSTSTSPTSTRPSRAAGWSACTRSLARLEPALAGAPVPWDWDAFGAARAHYAELGLAAPDPEAGR